MTDDSDRSGDPPRNRSGEPEMSKRLIEVNLADMKFPMPPSSEKQRPINRCGSMAGLSTETNRFDAGSPAPEATTEYLNEKAPHAADGLAGRIVPWGRRGLDRA